MVYLVTQIIVCIFAAAAAGLVMGWLLWGRLVSRQKAQMSDLRATLAPLEPLPARIAAMEVNHRTALAERDRGVEHLKARAVELEASHAERDRLAARLSEKLTAAESTHRSTVAKYEEAQARCREQLAKYEVLLTDAMAHERRLETRIQGLQVELAESGEVEDRLHAKVAEGVAEVGRVESELETVRARLTALETAHAAALTGHQALVAQLRRDLDRANESCRLAEEQHSAETARIREELTAERDRVSAALRLAEEQRGAEAPDRDGLFHQLAAAEAEVAHLRQESETLAAERDRVSAALRLAEAQRGADAPERDGLIHQLAAAEAEVAHLRQESETLAAERDRVSAALRLAEAQRGAEAPDRDSLADRLASAEAEVAHLRQESETLAAERDRVSAALRLAEEQRGAEAADRDGLIHRLAAAEAEVAHLRQEAETLAADRDRVSATLRLAEEQRDADAAWARVVLEPTAAEDLEVARAERDAHAESILEKDRAIAGFERHIAALEDAHAAMSAQLDSRQAEIGSLLQKLDQQIAEVRAQNDSITAAGALIAEQQEELARLREAAASTPAFRPLAAAAGAVAGAGIGIPSPTAGGSQGDFSTEAVEARYQRELASRDAEIAALRSRIEEYEPQAVAAVSHYNRFQEAIAEREGELEALQEKVQSLERANAGLERALGERDAGKGSPAIARLEELERRGNNVEYSLSSKDRQIADLQARLSALEQSAAALAALPPPQQKAAKSKEAEAELMRRLLQSLVARPDRDEVSRIAYGFAAARDFQGGSPVEDWLRAEAQVRFELRNAWQPWLGQIVSHL